MTFWKCSTHLLHLGELPAGVIVVPQVLLVAHQDNGNIGTEVLHLRGPLLWNVLCGERNT